MVDQVAIRVITEFDLEAMDIPREVINGQWAEWTEMAGKLHGRLGKKLLFALDPFVTANKLGEVYPDGVSYVLQGTKQKVIVMRIPDVSFVAADRVDETDPGSYYLAPDLAIEVLSPTEEKSDTDGKIKDYLRFGTRQVWVVDPDHKQVRVHLPNGTVNIYEIGQKIPGGDVLPGFELAVADIFTD